MSCTNAKCLLLQSWLLAGIVLARLGAEVVLTDLLPNLPLLADNCKANGMAGTFSTGFDGTNAAGHFCRAFLASLCLHL